MKKIYATVLLGVMIIVFSSATSYAEIPKTKELSKTVLFAVPEGGWSSCKVHIIYTETYKYKSSTNKNRFDYRTKYYTGIYEYATSKPVLSTGRVDIQNSSNTLKSFTSWTRETSIYPGDVDTFGYYSNSGYVNLSPSTSYDGYLRYSVTCSGAAVPSRGGSVIINLSTAN